MNNEGRSKIDDPNRINRSKRAQEGQLNVLYRKCPHCGHHKIFSYYTGRKKCCKCKRPIE